MLQIHHIKKEYRTGDLVQKALDDVSLTLRDNEFVAILGPSGSGKTTLLNIIGGLDRYDSGDLVINGISTRKYTDRDWDSYRNHTIGFVFQSYNLIPHQSVLSNVELALTISGISGEERKRRALDALEKVGLKDQAHKKPNQMSGGQMQRVAIARALVNDPDILLADEPTGALDTSTSVLVMDLLKEVARDRLVVMVTHNPELAQQYATRIVRLQDGKIRSDSDPVSEHVPLPEDGKKQTMGKSSMSFLTALSLSFQNLWTKKARTLLTAFAGSIGIIGIAAILSLSTGVNNYIQNVEEETLSEYPLEISKSTVSLGSMASAAPAGTIASGSESEEEEEIDVTQTISVSDTLTRMFSSTDSNDLKSLKEFLESGQSDIDEYAKAIEYEYNVTPLIYKETEDEVRQVNPDQTFSSLGFGSSASSSSLFSSMLSTDVFHEMPANASLYEDQYEVLAGNWPEQYDECVLVLGRSGSVSDLLLYTMGLRDPDDLDSAISEFVSNEQARLPEYSDTYTYEDILEVTFKLISSTDCYVYDETLSMWVDKSNDPAYMKEVVKNGDTLKISGIVIPSEDANGAALSTGINYPASLTEHIVEKAAGSQIVKDQLADPDINVLTGEPFGSDDERTFDLSSLFSVNEDALNEMFQVDPTALTSAMDFSGALSGMDLNLDTSSLMNLASLDFSGLNIDSSQMETLTAQLARDLVSALSQDDLSVLFDKLMEGYEQYAAEHPDLASFDLESYLRQYLESEEAGEILQNAMNSYLQVIQASSVSNLDVTQLMSSLLSGFDAWKEQMGYDDPENSDTYLREYLTSSAASGLLTKWLNENLKIEADASRLSEISRQLASDLSTGYQEYASANGFVQPSVLARDFLSYLSSQEASDIISDNLHSLNDVENAVTTAVLKYASAIGSLYGSQISSQISSQVSSIAAALISQLQSGIQNALVSSFSGLESQMESLMNFQDAELADLFDVNMDMDDITQLVSSMQTNKTPTYESNLEALGYADFSDPTSISFYPYNFESKDEITAILADYNSRMKAEGYPEKVISYTDVVGTLMTSVTDIVGLISNVLIAFVSISLIVSSIMIGVITYISVLERQKEIGILRAMGASKRNISEVFNAETMIIGFAAGLIGIGLTLILLIPGNMIIHAVADTTAMNAQLPAGAAILLIFLSVVLTVLGGLIPAMKASNSNPVTALRTE